MLVIKTVSGGERRIPLADIESTTEIETSSGAERPPPPHPYLHREGVNRGRPRADPAHTDQAVRG
jgi:hypothetical protein